MIIAIVTSRPNAKGKPRTWTRKGECPSCGVGCGSYHSKGCKVVYTPKIIRENISDRQLCPECRMPMMWRLCNGVECLVCLKCE